MATAAKKAVGSKALWRMVGAIVIAAIILWLLYTVSASMRNWVQSKVPGAQ